MPPFNVLFLLAAHLLHGPFSMHGSERPSDSIKCGKSIPELKIQVWLCLRAFKPAHLTE